MITVEELIKQAFAEDIEDGDHTTLATVDKDIIQKARLLVKDNGMIAGVDIARKVFNIYDSSIKMETFIEDGTLVKNGDIAFIVEGKAQSILTAERLALNIMQRMSGIATRAHRLNELIKDTNCKLLDTRKTTPNFRIFEKEAVKIGGGNTLRFGLFDMILIKDNHVDYSGGITNALNKTSAYLKQNNKDLKIEIEIRNIPELKEVLSIGGVYRILIDNFDTTTLKDAVALVKEYNANNNTKIYTEASGGINETNIREYALTGVDFISLGVLTHSYKSLDLSLKAYK